VSPSPVPDLEPAPDDEYRWNADGPPQDFKGAVVTCRDLLAKLNAMVAERPSLLDYPIHILDMESDETEGAPTSGLVTFVETDMFDGRLQGAVIDLISDPKKRVTS
jgi:hypothetical protein